MPNSPVVTRIAPSPTGFMHIGTARTALFNWLYARGRGGKFLLRIEDTDRARSTPEATEAILDGMRWLGLDWDGEAVSQFERAARHAEVAHAMLASGAAFKCFSTQDEIEAYREAARADGKSTLFRSPWRDRPSDDHPEGAPFVVRIKAPRDGETIIHDKVQGDVTIRNSELDDFVLLRSDGTPTYMLAVVVDDHDMGVTHVIRGDDHLNNAARQMLIYAAMDWPRPVHAHIPLIHGDDGKKLSKRHGALGVMDWAAAGYPAQAMRNYLTRLGWSHGNDEFFTDAQAREWFDLKGIGKAPARFDTKKLGNLSSKHLAAMSESEIMDGLRAYFAAAGSPPPGEDTIARIGAALPAARAGAKTYEEIVDKAHFNTIERPIHPDEKSAQSLDDVSRGILSELTPHLQNATWTRDNLERILSQTAQDHELKFGALAAPLRAALAGRSVTPSVYDMMLILGAEETVARLKDASKAH